MQTLTDELTGIKTKKKSRPEQAKVLEDAIKSFDKIKPRRKVKNFEKK